MDFEKVNENVIRCEKKTKADKFPKEVIFMETDYIYGCRQGKMIAIYFKKGYFT